MTTEQKEQITNLRSDGQSYGKIAALMGLSENTVKSYCRRNGLTGVFGITESSPEQVCLYCGKPVEQESGRKEKKFCCVEHRRNWWNSHRFLIGGEKAKEYTCPTCHKTFKAYEHAHRKYCSHQCYILWRFGGEADV